MAWTIFRLERRTAERGVRKSTRSTFAGPEAAISDFVSLIMALSAADPRAAPAHSLLTAHFQAALAQAEVSATDALRSTFVIACLSPSLVSIGL